MGSFLYDRGIQFTNYPFHTIEDVCLLHRIETGKLLAEMEDWNSDVDKPSLNDLRSIPIDLLVAYLQGVHQRFLCRRLPYMQKLVDSLNPIDFDESEIIRDLKLIFPIFVSDFIHHIHEEEDHLFNRVLEIDRIVKRGGNPGRFFLLKSKNCLHEMAMDHHEDDDDMRGIRNLTNNYTLPEKAGLNLKVIFAELECFERELRRHASIENEILFPKAIRLQKELESKIERTLPLN